MATLVARGHYSARHGLCRFSGANRPNGISCRRVRFAHLDTSFVALQTATQETELKVLADLQSAEDVISSPDGAFSGLVNELFTPLDQAWYQASEALLSADHAFDAAAVSGSGVAAAEFGEIVANLQLLGDALDSAPVYLGAMLF